MPSRELSPCGFEPPRWALTRKASVAGGLLVYVVGPVGFAAPPSAALHGSAPAALRPEAPAGRFRPRGFEPPCRALTRKASVAGGLLVYVVGPVGFEPTTLGLKAGSCGF